MKVGQAGSLRGVLATAAVSCKRGGWPIAQIGRSLPNCPTTVGDHSYLAHQFKI
jgi:hypothetical protein